MNVHTVILQWGTNHWLESICLVLKRKRRLTRPRMIRKVYSRKVIVHDPKYTAPVCVYMYVCIASSSFVVHINFAVMLRYGHNDDDVTADRNSWMNCDGYLIMTKGKCAQICSILLAVPFKNQKINYIL